MRALTLAMVVAMAIAVACRGEDRETDDERTEAVPRIGHSLTLTDPALFALGANGDGTVVTFDDLVRGLLPIGSSQWDRSDLVKAWLVDWSARRPGVREKILCPWLEASTGQPLCRDGVLDLAKAPFKPVAVVNRMDLHDPDHCEDAGELRIAFSWVDADRKEQPLMLVFEYAVPTHNLPVAAWAERWLDLESLACSAQDCADYRGAVGNLVSEVTASPFQDEGSEDGEIELEGDEGMMLSKRAPRVSAKSTLRHVRIHDRALGETDFREYDLALSTGRPRLAATDTPATGKCQGCHTGAGAAGERFNLNPGAAEGQRMHPDIMAMMPARAERLPDLRHSVCEPVGGEVRSVPW